MAKKKSQKKKHYKKSSAKIKKKKKTVAPRARKTKKDNSEPDVIFDSKVGKTDALFVDNSEEK